MARSVLLTSGTVINTVELPVCQDKKPDIRGSVKTIDENERDYIVAILNKCGGKVNGTGGAAELMNIAPSTLKSRMIKLGIAKKSNYL